MYARQDVVDQLRGSLEGSGTSLVEIGLPPGESSEQTVAGLIGKLQSVSGSVVSITGVEWAFPEQGNRLDTLVGLSFQRETLGLLPVRQIWWIPSSLTERFVLGVPDLDSWFQLRLHLTEVPAPPAEVRREFEGVRRKSVSVAEARSVARRFWERLEAARQQNIPEERIWTELAQPAVDALLSAGLGLEADAILASTRVGRDSLERQFHELSAARGPEDPEVLLLAERVARSLSGHGDLAGARRLQERVLEVRERALGEEHPTTLVSMNNLALTLMAQGDYAGARRLQERLLEMSKRLLGEEHPDTLTVTNNLAVTLRVQGDYAGARRLQQRVLEVSKRVLGKEHRDTLSATNNLAVTLRMQGDYAGARRVQERVLDLATRLLGDEHPDTLTAMNNLASTLSEQGDSEGARRLQERAVEVFTRVLGNEHPKTLTAMNNLALTLFKAGDREDAVRLLRKCLLGRREVLGDSHPSTVAAAERLTRMEAQVLAGQPGG